MDRFEQPVGPVGPSSRRTWRAVAAVGAAVVTVVTGAAWIAVNPAQPSPTPSRPVALASAAATLSAPPTASPLKTSSGAMPPPGDSVPPSPTITPGPTVPPTYPPGAFADRPAWRINLFGVSGPVAVLLIDPGEQLLDAVAAATRPWSAGFEGAIVPTDDPGSIDVYWPGSTCDGWDTVTLAADGTVTVVPTPVDTACKRQSAVHGIKLRFATSMEGRRITLVMGPERRYPGDLIPQAVSFADATFGLAAMGDGGTVAVAETADGGETWRLTPIGDGRVRGLVADGPAFLLAVSCNPSMWDHCASGVYRQQSPRSPWVPLLTVEPGGIAAWGSSIVVIEQGPENDQGGAPEPTGIQLSNDAGTTWTHLPVPCPAAQPILSSVALGSRLQPLAVCESTHAEGERVLLSRDDATGQWTPVAQLPRIASGIQISTALRITGDPKAGLPGLLWSHGSALFATTDSGATWTELPAVADGQNRTMMSAQAWPNGGGTVLVYDRARSARLLLVSRDGKAWTEVTSFRELPCCGG